MRIAAYSDLHLECVRHEWRPRLAADVEVLVVGGDVYEGDLARGVAWAAAVADGRPCIMVAGNHEFWGRTIEDELDRGAEVAVKSGVVLLNGQGWVDVAGARFAGGTLWTDMTLNHALGQRIYAREFGEPIDVRGAGIDRRAKASDALRWHRRDVEALEAALGEEVDGRARIVVTHHAPSDRCVSARHRGKLSAAYSASNLEHLLVAEADLWLFGHVHSSVDFVSAGGTRVLSNPFGYHGENAGFVEDLVVEVPSSSSRGAIRKA